MDISQTIALNLKRLRTERNLSLGQLAQESGVSKVVLSQLEKGDANPTINTLWKIATGLHVPYSALMETPTPDVSVVRAADASTQEDDDGSYRLHCFFSSTPTRDFEFFVDDLDAGAEHVTNGHSEKSREYLYIIEGTLEVEVGGQAIRLSAGDAVSFDAAQRHVYRNLGTTTCRMVCINHYPV